MRKSQWKGWLMSFFYCVSDAINEICDPKKRYKTGDCADYVQGVWRETADQYERKGDRGTLLKQWQVKMHLARAL